MTVTFETATLITLVMTLCAVCIAWGDLRRQVKNICQKQTEQDATDKQICKDLASHVAEPAHREAKTNIEKVMQEVSKVSDRMELHIINHPPCLEHTTTMERITGIEATEHQK